MSIKEALKFEQDLYNLINNSGLPVHTAFYVLKSVYLDFENTLYKCVKNEGEPFTEETITMPLDEEANIEE